MFILLESMRTFYGVHVAQSLVSSVIIMDYCLVLFLLIILSSLRRRLTILINPFLKNTGI
jgi:hypothetical protein